MTAVHDYSPRPRRAPGRSASVDKKREVVVRGIPEDLFNLIAVPIFFGFLILGVMIIAWVPTGYVGPTILLLLVGAAILFGGGALFHAAYAKSGSGRGRSGAIIILIALMLFGIVGIIAGPFAPRVDSGGWDDFKRHVNYNR